MADLKTKTPTSTQTPSESYVAILRSITGRYVTVSHRDGSKYEGVLHTFELGASGSGIDLQVVSRKGALHELALKPEKQKLIALEDIVRIDCKYSLHEDVLGARAQSLHEVRVDSEISSGSHGKERELQAWVVGDDAASPASVNLDDWDDSHSKKHFSGWDQFAVNERKFGVRTTYDENLYTTSLDRSSISKEAEAAAAKLAAEIEGTVASHALQAEERGQTVAGSEHYDEEARYSTVLRAGEEHLAGGKVDSTKARSPAASSKPADGHAAGSAAEGGGADSAGAPASAPAAKSRLNPNAKEFTFNPKAKEFVPGPGLGGGGGGGGGGLMFGAMQLGMGGLAGMQAGMQMQGAGPAGYQCGYPPGVAGAGFGPGAGQLDRRAGDFVPAGLGGVGPFAQMPQMMRPPPGAGQLLIGRMPCQAYPQTSPTHGQLQLAASMASGLTRAPPQYAIPPAPPVQAIFVGGAQQQMAAMRGMQPGAPFAAYGMAASPQQQQQQQQQPGGARFPPNAAPQPPRQAGAFPPRIG